LSYLIPLQNFTYSTDRPKKTIVEIVKIVSSIADLPFVASAGRQQIICGHDSLLAQVRRVFAFQLAWQILFGAQGKVRLADIELEMELPSSVPLM
jgi:hypothetical protein